jgi:hypothetical protein
MADGRSGMRRGPGADVFRAVASPDHGVWGRSSTREVADSSAFVVVGPGGLHDASIHNRTSQLVLIAFEARLRCVYANGPTFPAPVHTTGSETQRGEVSAGDTLDVSLECGHEAFVSDGAWVTDATIDLSVVEDWDPWN